jgi:hypothetical protein
MNNYEDGKEYFLKGTAQAGDSLGWSVVFFYNNGIGVSCGKLSDEPGILLTAEEICTGEDSCKRLKEIDAVNHEQAEKILSLQRDLMTAKTNYNSCSDELAECKKKLKEAEATIRTLTKKNRCLRKEADRGDVIAKALADTILDICDNGDLILEEE